MSFESIGSRKHPAAARLRAVRDGDDKLRLFVEGARLAQEAADSGLALEEFYFTPAFAESAGGAALIGLLSKRAAGRRLAADVMDFVSDLKTPPGLVLIAKRPAPARPAAKKPLFVVLDGLQLPSNVGAVFRTAEAAGADAVFHAGGADPLGPKALRASAGSAFRLPVFTAASVKELAAELAADGVACVAADPRGKTPYTKWNWKKPVAVILRPESERARPAGGDDGIATVAIPMSGAVESLNVAAAAAVLLFEARRQRAAIKK